MTVVRRADLTVTPWKNGLGRKADLAEGDGWFVGLAWLDRDAAFSDFPGTDRTCALVEGAGFTLEVEGAPPLVYAAPGTAHAFPGDVPTRCVLTAGPCVVLNVMTRRGDLDHQVEVGGALPPDGWSVVLQGQVRPAARDSGDTPDDVRPAVPGDVILLPHSGIASPDLRVVTVRAPVRAQV
jgi:hypothetical protein